jgi:hypothetical protein
MFVSRGAEAEANPICAEKVVARVKHQPAPAFNDRDARVFDRFRQRLSIIFRRVALSRACAGRRAFGHRRFRMHSYERRADGHAYRYRACDKQSHND